METKNVGHVAKGEIFLDAPPRGCEEFMTRRKGGGQGFWTFERPKGVNIFSSDGILDFKEGCKGVEFQRGF